MDNKTINLRELTDMSYPKLSLLIDGQWIERTAAGSLQLVDPLPLIAEPDEMAGCALFLATEDASFLTGTALLADGRVCTPAAARAV